MTHATARRPRALAVLGWLLIAQGLLALAVFGLLLAVLLAALTIDPAVLPGLPRGAPVLLSAGAGLTSVFSLVSGVGLLRRQAWAWLLALIVQGVVLLVALADYWLGNPDYLSLGLGVVQVYLLNRSDVQQAVRPAGPHTAEPAPLTLPGVALEGEEAA